MPIISFTEADTLQSVLVEAGTHPIEVVTIEGPQASKSGNSIKFYTTIRITGGQYAGKEVTVCMSTGTKDSNVFQGMQYLPKQAFLEIEAAVNNTKVKPVARPDFDTDSILNKPLEAVFAVETENGKLINTVTGFLPSGSSTAKPAW